MKTVANISRAPTHPTLLARVKFLLAAAIIALALYLLIPRLQGISREQIGNALYGISAKALWVCGALTGVSFLALGSYDMIAVRMVAAQRTSPGRAWLVGTVANAFSNTLGFHVLTAMSVRYRMLARSGLNVSEVAGVTALSWTALGFGFASMLSLATGASPQSSPWQRIGGVMLLGTLLLFARWLGTGKIIRLGKIRLPLPSGRLALVQMALGAIEMASAIGALYMLMPAGAVPSFPAFSTLYIGAVLLGIASHAPGGLGVFEAAMLALSDGQNRIEVLAALLVYRLIYNIVPFLLGALALAADEMWGALNSRADSV